VGGWPCLQCAAAEMWHVVCSEVVCSSGCFSRHVSVVQPTVPFACPLSAAAPPATAPMFKRACGARVAQCAGATRRYRQDGVGRGTQYRPSGGGSGGMRQRMSVVWRPPCCRFLINSAMRRRAASQAHQQQFMAEAAAAEQSRQGFYTAFTTPAVQRGLRACSEPAFT